MAKVLIAEDDIFIADLLEDAVREAGFDVCGVATTAADAIALGERYRPDLALLDVQLAEGGDGIEVAERLLQKMGVAILYTTGNCEQVLDRRARGIGCLAKPFTQSDAVLALSIVNQIASSGITPDHLPEQLRLIKPA